MSSLPLAVIVHRTILKEEAAPGGAAAKIESPSATSAIIFATKLPPNTSDRRSSVEAFNRLVIELAPINFDDLLNQEVEQMGKMSDVIVQFKKDGMSSCVFLRLRHRPPPSAS
ncbi:MAG: hypothetical protein R3D69_12075 [Xanthobacteraceae bacterium]